MTVDHFTTEEEEKPGRANVPALGVEGSHWGRQLRELLRLLAQAGGPLMWLGQVGNFLWHLTSLTGQRETVCVDAEHLDQDQKRAVEHVPLYWHMERGMYTHLLPLSLPPFFLSLPPAKPQPGPE